jgi:hypothetical protein
MKLLRSRFIFFLFASLFLLFFPLKTLAQTNSFQGQEVVTLSKNQTINHDYFAAGKQVVIDGTINGDAYVVGGQVDVNGTINGDLLVAGGQINIKGAISQDIRAAGGNIALEGSVGKNITMAGGNLTIHQTAKIIGNTVMVGGNSEILAQVNNLTLAGGYARIGSNVLGDITAGVGTLDILPDSTIYGDLEYWSNNKVSTTPSTKIIGQTTFHRTQFQTDMKKSSEKTMETIFGIGIFFTIVGFTSSLILGILLICLLPVYTQKTADVIRNKFWTSLLVGFITFIIVPIIAFILVITLVGTPVAFALISIYIMVIYIAKLFAMLTIGKFVIEKVKWNFTPIWTFIIGIALYYIVGLVPVVGGLTKIVVMLVSIGAIMIQERNYYSMFRKKKII